MTEIETYEPDDDLSEDELEKVKKEIEEYKRKKQVEELRNKLEAAKQQDKWKEEHKGFMKVQEKTKKIESGVKGIFKGLGKAIVGTAKALQKSDQWIAEQQAKENQLNKGKPKQKSDVEDALYGLD